VRTAVEEAGALRDVTLQLNTLGDTAARHRHREKLIAYFEQHTRCLDADATRRLHSNPLRILDSKNPAMQELIAAAPKLMDELEEDALQHFAELQAILKRHDVPFEINPRLVRGLDYYNRTVFEWVTTRLGAQARSVPAGVMMAWSSRWAENPPRRWVLPMGVERLLALVQEDAWCCPSPRWMCMSCIRAIWPGNLPAGWRKQLRDGELRVLLHCGGGSFKSQMKKPMAAARGCGGDRRRRGASRRS